jgi:hypothetical protein
MLHMKYSVQCTYLWLDLRHFLFLRDSGDISGVTEHIFLKKEKIVLSSGVLKILYQSGWAAHFTVKIKLYFP